MVWCPSFQSVVRADGRREYRVGHELIDEFLEFASGRARPNTVRAYAHDLSVFFAVIPKEPAEVTPRDVLRFVTAQRQPRKGAENVVRISDGESGLSPSTIKRRLAAVSSLYGYLVIRGDAGVVTNPVPRGLPTRRNRHRGERGAPLVRGVRRLPRILDLGEVEALMAALRTERDRAMAQAMLLGGLRRCEVLGLGLRHFAGQVFEADPTCTSMAAVERRHIEAHKLWLAARPGKAGKPLATVTIRHRLGLLRTFFERFRDWDYEDAPSRTLIFPGDFPQADEPLPKFLDDPTMEKFAAALWCAPDFVEAKILELRLLSR